MQFNFIGGSGVNASVNQNAERTYNLYPEKDETGHAKNKMILLGTPGLSIVNILPTSPIRAMFASGTAALNASRLFVVAGAVLYEVGATGLIVGGMSRGNVGTDAQNSPVQMFANGNQLMIISAGKVYIDNGGAANGANATAAMYPNQTYAGVVTTNTATPNYVTWVSGDQFTPAMVGGTIVISGTNYTVAAFFNGQVITVVAGPGTLTAVAYTMSITGAPVLGTTGGYLDGYFIAQTPSSTQFQISAIHNGLSWNPIDFAVKEGSPDLIVSVLVDHEVAWFFGDNTTEIFRDTGAATFPLVRDTGGFMQQGCAAPWSAVSLNTGVAWIGGDTLGNAAAWYAQAYVPARISTHAVETAWASYPVINDATAYVYEMAGHIFWVINFPTQGATWVYDAIEQFWHERGSLIAGAQGRHLVSCHAFAFGAHYVGDFSSGNLYLLSPNAFTDNGAAITRIRTAPHISDDMNWTFYENFQLDMETSASAGTVTLDYSNDGGHTFGALHTVSSAAASGYGNFWHRVIWRRLGRSRDRVFRITITAAIKIALINAFVKSTKGLF